MKTISFLLSLLMCLSLFPNSALAADAEPTDLSQWILVDDLPYDSAYALEGEYILVGLDLDHDGWTDKHGLLDSTGKEIIPPVYDYVSAVTEGMVIVAQNVDNDPSTGTDQVTMYRGLDKFGVFDVQGNQIVPLKYDYIDDFSDGLAAIYHITHTEKELVPGTGVMISGTENKIGFIDRTGREVIPAIYDDLRGLDIPTHSDGYGKGTGFSEGLVCVRKGNTWEVIDKEGKTAFQKVILSGFSEGLAKTIVNNGGIGKYGYVDKRGNMVIPAIYDSARDFSNGYAIVGKKNANGEYLYGAIDTKGNVVVPLEYPHMCPFQEGRAMVWKADESGKDKYGFVDTTGKLVVPMIYDSANNFSNGLASVYLANVLVETDMGSDYFPAHGYIDKQGNLVIPMKYSEAFAFSNGMAQIHTGEGDAYAAGTSKETIEAIRQQYRKLGIAFENFYIDTTGKKIISFGKETPSASFSEKIGVCKKPDGKYVIIRNPSYQEGSKPDSTATEPVAQQPDTPQSAAPTKSSVLVNGQVISFDAYSINGNNYFKLRDLAQVLSGTEKQFEVAWDNAKQAINLVSQKPYTSVGGELTAGDGNSKTAQPSTAEIFLDGQAVQVSAYTINGSNYFKLRDVGKLFDFAVMWDQTSQAIIIDTAEPYTAE